MKADRILLALLALPGLLAAAPRDPGPPADPPRVPDQTLLKDVVRLEGAATTKLEGDGLVMGLAGTGDKSARTKKMALLYYKSTGSTFDLADLDSKNMAAVHLTADLPSDKARGDLIDVTVSASEGATSLRNGILISTVLVGPGAVAPGAPAKPVLAFAQGPVLVGDGSAPHLTVGRVVGGGTVLKPNPGRGEIVKDGKVALLLQAPDFANAQRVAQAVNAEFEREARPGAEPLARAAAANRVEVLLPEAYRACPVEFLSRVQELPVSLVKERARVVVNARTGVVTYTGDVRLSAVQVSFGEKGEVTLYIEEGGSLAALLEKLDKVSTPARKLEVLQNLHAMGALRAELVIL